MNKSFPSIKSYFKNRTAVIANKHGKERVIAPILEKALGLKIIVPEEIDTDQFGTFTLDIPRKGSQLEVARNKALEGIRLTGLDIGIASEGTFSPYGLTNADTEIVLLYDLKNNWEFVGGSKSLLTNIAETYVNTVNEALLFAKQVGFPKHGLVVRKNKNDTKYMKKGITNKAELKETVGKILQLPFNNKAFLETDMRAHLNPTRMDVIQAATLDLVQTIKRRCMECGTPGMQYIRSNPGLVCSSCGLKTDNTLSITYECQSCQATKDELYPYGIKVCDPANCQWCNP
ncbi:MAG: hypothetical protein M1554_02340 [Patescibacteria group bacterium]|jgi:hypothetical protein|nr:hypothetical protein [Patescibacteria group bacterium]